MRKIYIIAGNFDQYRVYKEKKLREAINTDNHDLGQETQCYTYLSNPDMLKGVKDPEGVFIGTWYDREDARDIVDNLLIASWPRTSPNPGIQEASRVLGAASSKRTGGRRI